MSAELWKRAAKVFRRRAKFEHETNRRLILSAARAWVQHDVCLENLTATQARCTELLEEVRMLRREFAPRSDRAKPEEDFVSVREKDLDRVKVLLGLDPVQDGIAQVIERLEQRSDGAPQERCVYEQLRRCILDDDHAGRCQFEHRRERATTCEHPMHRRQGMPNAIHKETNNGDRQRADRIPSKGARRVAGRRCRCPGRDMFTWALYRTCREAADH